MLIFLIGTFLAPFLTARQELYGQLLIDFTTCLQEERIQVLINLQ